MVSFCEILLYNSILLSVIIIIDGLLRTLSVVDNKLTYQTNRLYVQFVIISFFKPIDTKILQKILVNDISEVEKDSNDASGSEIKLVLKFSLWRMETQSKV